MKNSAIQWTDHTFNSWEGCAKVAPECKNCYAETLVDKRFGRAKWGKGQPRRRTSANLWKQPIAWNRDAGMCKCGETEASKLHDCSAGRYDVSYFEKMKRARVFCLSLGDWLDEEVPIHWLTDLLKLIHATRNLDWQLLTKRPQNFKERISEALKHLARMEQYNVAVDIRDWLLNQNPLPNVWIGVSAGADQRAALDIPAKIHFLSCEPMLHPFDATHAKGFDWIIFGGESGKNARPCDIDWIRQGLAFCRANHIAPFVKQLGANVRDTPLSEVKWPNGTRGVDIYEGDCSWTEINLKNSHGGDIQEWPEDLRVREFPTDIR